MAQAPGGEAAVERPSGTGRPGQGHLAPSGYLSPPPAAPAPVARNLGGMKDTGVGGKPAGHNRSDRGPKLIETRGEPAALATALLHRGCWRSHLKASQTPWSEAAGDTTGVRPCSWRYGSPTVQWPLPAFVAFFGGVIFTAAGLAVLRDFAGAGTRMTQRNPRWGGMGSVDRQRTILGAGYLLLGLVLLASGVAMLLSWS